MRAIALIAGLFAFTCAAWADLPDPFPRWGVQ